MGIKQTLPDSMNGNILRELRPRTSLEKVPYRVMLEYKVNTPEDVSLPDPVEITLRGHFEGGDDQPSTLVSFKIDPDAIGKGGRSLSCSTKTGIWRTPIKRWIPAFIDL